MHRRQRCDSFDVAWIWTSITVQVRNSLHLERTARTRFSCLSFRELLNRASVLTSSPYFDGRSNSICPLSKGWSLPPCPSGSHFLLKNFCSRFLIFESHLLQTFEKSAASGKLLYLVACFPQFTSHVLSATFLMAQER